MSKTILITGATDGIGFETAKLLAAGGHHLLIHGRSADKLARTQAALVDIAGAGPVDSYRADLSALKEVVALAEAIRAAHPRLDVLINNAGVYKVDGPTTVAGLDLRFVVNTLAPFVLTRALLGIMTADGRVVNLSSAAQAPVDHGALVGELALSHSEAYAQSKLAITMWSFGLARALGPGAPVIVAVNPASLLASKMVKEAYGVAGNDLSIGARVLVSAALGEEFADARGRYYDNDQQRFADPHPDALDSAKTRALLARLEQLIDQRLSDSN